MTSSHPPSSSFSTACARLRRLPGWLAARPAAAFLLLLAVGWLCYYPSLGGDFVWDDGKLVQNNPAIRSPVFIPEVFRHHLTFDSPAPFYRPVQNLSFMGDYLLWELEPYGYRLTNLLLHVANAGLLFLLLRRVLPKLVAEQPFAGSGDHRQSPVAVLALIVALFWMVHPVHSAAVAYISGRADSLAMGFALLAWLAWERGNAAAARSAALPAAAWFVAGAGALLLALCSKEIALIWLALFGLYFLLGKPALPVRRCVLSFVAALLVLGGYAVLRHLPEMPPDTFVPPIPLMPSKPVLMARSLGDYAGVLLWPARLFMERQVFPAYGKAPTSADQWRYHAQFAGGLVTLAVLLLGAVWRAPGQRLRRFGAAWFLLAWLPVSNLWQLNASVAEHWLYVPSVGFLLFLAGVALAVPALPSSRLSQAWAFAPAALVAALALLVARTNFRSADWFDDMTFYQQTLAAGTRSPRARLMLARAMARGDRAAEGEREIRAMIVDYPAYGMARLNLALALMRQDRAPEAAELLHALRDSTLPSHRALLPTVWRTLMRLPGENSDAETTLSRLEADFAKLPHAWELVEIKARLLCQLGRLPEAETVVRTFHATHSWHYLATMLLAEMAEEREDFTRAEALYRAAGRLDVHEVASRRARAMLLLREQHPEAARQLAQEAISRQPGQALNYLVLAQALTALGRSQEAAAAAAQAARLGTPLAATAP